MPNTKKISKEELEEKKVSQVRKKLVERIRVHVDKGEITPEEAQRITDGWR